MSNSTIQNVVKSQSITGEFGQDVIKGLSQTPKRLFSKYFYDETGDSLFQEIMGLEEYYLTRAELEIFMNQKHEILKYIGHGEPFRLIELGAGDGAKTKVLLQYFLKAGASFQYAPVDISGNVLSILEKNVKDEIPSIRIESHVGDYFEVLEELKFKDDINNVVFFLGSNIGNYNPDEARKFLDGIRKNLKKGDILLIGIDLKKDPRKILAAYNDSRGVTSRFNLNLLSRINEEFDGDFDVSSFTHYPTYNPISGECRSFLISKKQQQVSLRALDFNVEFQAWEPIATELSKKYEVSEIESLAFQTGFHVQRNLFDSNGYYTDSIWEAQ